MRALILAAGQGKRLGKASKNKPKCLMELFGKSILQSQIEVFNSNKITEINIVTGFKSNHIKKFKLNSFHNEDYKETNMVFSMFKASELFESNKSDLIVSYGDIVYEKNNLKKLIKSKSPVSVAVDLNWKNLWDERFDNPLDDAETMKFDSNSNILELGKKTNSYDDIQGQYIGLIKFKKDYLKEVREIYIDFVRTNPNEYKNLFMTDFLQLLINKNIRVNASLVEGGWLEIDTEKDIISYENLYKSGDLKKFYNY